MRTGVGTRVAAGVLVLSALTVGDPAGAQETGNGEAVRLVATAAQYRDALSDLSTNINPGPHTVRLTADITLVADNEPTYTGTRQLIIDGDGHTVDGNGLNRAIDHQSTSRLTLRELTIRNGHAPAGNDGGAVTVDGALTIDGVTFEANVSEANGGAVETVTGGLTIMDSTFVGNTAANLGGAVEAGDGALTVTNTTFTDNVLDDPLFSPLGGGALSHGGGVATITDSTFTGNEVLGEDDGQGGAVRAIGDGITFTNTTFTDNSISEGWGGAVHGSAGTSVEVVGSTFTGNHVLGAVSASRGGGAIHTYGDLDVTDSTFVENDVTGGAGGAILIGSNATATVNDSELEDNATLGTGSGGGGAIASDADLLTVTSTRLSGNSVAGTGADGGAIEGDTVLVQASDVRSNATTGSVAEGGGLAGNDLTVVDTWVVDNHVEGAGSTGGGVGGSTVTVERSLLLRNTATGTSGQGGAVGGVSVLTLTNSTLTENEASFAGGGVAAGSTATLSHATFGRNEAPTGAQLQGASGTDTTVEATVLAAPLGGGQDCATSGSGTITSAGHNRESGTSCGFAQPTDEQGLTDPMVGPLRYNGGATSSPFPLNGSPLVDQIPSGDCDAEVDQRGVARPFGGACDIGAVEQVFAEHAFTDVPTWVEDAVRWVGSPVNQPQIMVGITPTTFAPNDPISRAQVVRMLYNEEGAPDPSAYPPHGFTDVPPWVEDAVRWAKGEGIVDGITPTTFAPDDPITRAQVVRMKYRFAGSPDVSGIDPHPFTDVPAWVDDAVRWAADPENVLPLVTGITPTTFEPNDDITRAQVARMDYRLALTPAAWADAGDAPFSMLFTQGV